MFFGSVRIVLWCPVVVELGTRLLWFLLIFLLFLIPEQWVVGGKFFEAGKENEGLGTRVSGSRSK